MLSSRYTPLSRPVSHTYSTLQSKRAYDPTHTATLRAAFERAMDVKFAKLRGEIRKAVLIEDCFGLRPLKTNATMGKRAFDFGTSQDKVEAFMEWLNKESSAIILDTTANGMVKVGSGLNKAWTNTYIDSAYQKGISRARSELLAAGYDTPSVEAAGGIHALFNQPIHADRVGLLYTRVYTQLKGITDTMGTQISQVLSQGMMDGKNPMDIARILTRTITGPMGDLGITDTLGRFIPAQRRAQTLARTEIIRAHHLATVQEYRNFGVAGVNVKAELRTAGDGRVCEQCKSLEGHVYTLDAVEKIIPVHPSCRCCTIPVPMDEAKAKPVIISDVPKTTPVKAVGKPIVRTTPKPKAKAAPVKRVDPVASSFINKVDQDAYAASKAEYDEYFKSFSDSEIKKVKLEFGSAKNSVQDRLRADIPMAYGTGNGQGALPSWQGSPHKLGPMKMKLIASKAEKDIDFVHLYKNDAMLEEATASTLFDKSSYIKLRAFNQSYMERIKVKEVTLYRGTGKESAEAIRKSLTAAGTDEMRRTTFTITDSSIAGYSDSLVAAKFYGTGYGSGAKGMTWKIKVPKEDIILHKDLLSGMTGAYTDEAEFLVKGGVRTIDISQILKGAK